MKILDLTQFVEQIPNTQIRSRLLDLAFNLAIPFNRWLGMKIENLGEDVVRVSSPPRTLRKNHLGGAHACALALLGEYPAGILITQKYAMKDYRVILSKLSVEYHKQGYGVLIAEAKAPAIWPEEQNAQVWIELKTEIKNAKGDLVAVAETKWQLKRWDALNVEKQKKN